MEIRKLKSSEYVQFKGICQTVFFDMEREDVREMQKSPSEHAIEDSLVRLGFFDCENLMSALQIVPFTMHMNGHNVQMGGIGAVVTKPEARGRGQMEILLKAAFHEMSERGQAFSFLYPFSFAYYRKFGYEMCYAYNKVKIPVSQMNSYKCEVHAESFEPGDSSVLYEEIYRLFTCERNLSIVREESDWKRILDRDPYKNLEFTYLFRNNDGCVVAYILYNAERDDDDGNRLIIQECCWINPEALHLVFGFIAKLGAEFEYVHWNAPSDIDIYALFPEGFDLEWKRESAGMNRLVDVRSALSTLRAPSQSGSVILDVTDKFLPQNSGIYSVEWENGKLSVETPISVASMPDIETSVETLAQLVTGYITPGTAIHKKDTAILGNLSGLNALFPQRHLYIMERY